MPGLEVLVKKILVIDESPLFREYLSKKLADKKFEVVQGVNGLDGAIKMRRELPDLIIMDSYLTRKSSIEVLQERKENPNVSSHPVVIVSSKIDKEKLVELKPFNIRKIFMKPLKVDALLKTVAELLGEKIEMDDSPCIIEAHFNDEILFIEIALGLNIDKIELLPYKITELLELYQAPSLKVLVMLSNVSLSETDAGKIRALLRAVLDYGKAQPKNIKILTNDPYIKQYVARTPDFAGIEVTNTLESAMDALLAGKSEGAGGVGTHEKLLRSASPRGTEALDMRFEDDRRLPVEKTLEQLGNDVVIGVVDDDEVIRELVKTVFSQTAWNVHTYENGKQFVADVDKVQFDLIFLDLMMPEMDGFQVLEHLKRTGHSLPVIIFSALTRKETVVKAVGYGVSSYMIKPIRPERLLMKAAEILSTNF